MRKMLAVLALSGLGVMAFAVPAANAGTPSRSRTISRITSPTSPRPSPRRSTGSLSGTWSGQYGGAFNGTFSLTWQQTGTALSGNIKLSAPAISLGDQWHRAGQRHSFRHRGRSRGHHTGTVAGNGNSMSGTYQTAGQDGSWSATKGS